MRESSKNAWSSAQPQMKSQLRAFMSVLEARPSCATLCCIGSQVFQGDDKYIFHPSVFVSESSTVPWGER